MARNVKKSKGTGAWIGVKCHKKGIPGQDGRVIRSLEFRLRSRSAPPEILAKEIRKVTREPKGENDEDAEMDDSRPRGAGSKRMRDDVAG